MSSLSLLIKISFFFSLARLGFGTGGKSTLTAIVPLGLSRERGGKRGGGRKYGVPRGTECRIRWQSQGQSLMTFKWAQCTARLYCTV
jgi:hypothetical protein